MCRHPRSLLAWAVCLSVYGMSTAESNTAVLFYDNNPTPVCSPATTYSPDTRVEINCTVFLLHSQVPRNFQFAWLLSDNSSLHDLSHSKVYHILNQVVNISDGVNLTSTISFQAERRLGGKYFFKVNYLRGNMNADAFGYVDYIVPLKMDRLTQLSRVYEGETAELVCNAHGYPMPVIHWYRNGERILEKKGSRYILEVVAGVANAQLRVVNTTLEDRDHYLCNATQDSHHADGLVHLAVRRRLGALYPAVGILVEVAALFLIIILTEKYKGCLKITITKPSKGPIPEASPLLANTAV